MGPLQCDLSTSLDRRQPARPVEFGTASRPIPTITQITLRLDSRGITGPAVRRRPTAWRRRPVPEPGGTLQRHRRALRRRVIDNTYNAQHLLVLEGLEAVRKRPGMYIGSTDTRGLMHCLWEIIDNSVDEALAGVCTRDRRDAAPRRLRRGRTTTAAASRSTRSPRPGSSGVEVVFTKLHAGGKFGGGSYNATGGLHGVGSSVVNALSARLDVEVDRSPATQRMSFRRGAPGVFDGRPARRDAFTPAVRAAQGQAGRQGRSPAPGSGSGPTGRSSPRTPPSSSTSWSPGPGRPRSSCPGLELVIRDLRGAGAGRGALQARRRHHRVLRVPRARTSR